MTAFLSDYISYIQESRAKSEELDYYEMNQYFWKNIDSSHWREKRANFYRNYESVLHKFEGNADDSWLGQIKNFIARDNLLHYLPSIDQHWIDTNVNMLGFNDESDLLVRTRPVVFLSFHNFYQVLTPLLLAQYFGPVFAFALDEMAENDHLVRTYMAEMYKRMGGSFNGGGLLKVGAENTEASRVKLKEILEQKGSVYAAIDMIHPQLGNKTKVSLKADFFEFEVLAGVVDAGLKKDAQFVFPFISLVGDGTLRFEMFRLNGSTTEEVLSSYQKVFDSIILRDISVWEGASLLSYKDGKFS